MLRRPIARVRERMVLGQVRPLLEEHEHVAAWAHVHARESEQAGLISLTTERCLVHWTAGDEPTATIAWYELTGWRLESAGGDGTVLTLTADAREVAVRLPLTTQARAQTASRLVDQVVRFAPRQAGAPELGEDPTELAAQPRGVRGHARRIAVTVVGILVILVSALFASPFVPGPGALTFLAGLAILAKEYDWARDVHHWVKRKFEKLWNRWRARRERRREQRRIRRAATQRVRELPRPGNDATEPSLAFDRAHDAPEARGA